MIKRRLVSRPAPSVHTHRIMNLGKKLSAVKKSIGRVFSRVVSKFQRKNKQCEDVMQVPVCRVRYVRSSSPSTTTSNDSNIPLAFQLKWIRRSIVLCALIGPLMRRRLYEELDKLIEMELVTARSPQLFKTLEAYLAIRLNPDLADRSWEFLSAKNIKATQEELTEIAAMNLVKSRTGQWAKLESHLFMGLCPENATRFYNLIAVRRLIAVGEELAELRSHKLVSSVMRPVKAQMLLSRSWICLDYKEVNEEEEAIKFLDIDIKVKTRQEQLLRKMLRYR